MLNPNGMKADSKAQERPEDVLGDMTPKPDSFKGVIYPEEDVDRDNRLLDAYKHTPEYKEHKKRSTAELLEKVCIKQSELGDWFNEEDSYAEDPDWKPFITIPTCEIDDFFSHIDTIGMINNKDTNYDTIPFAFDITYNTDDEDLKNKFRWLHVYGKKNAPDGASEFGEFYTEKDEETGEDVVKTRSPLKFRYGLKIPGFASAKYFEDTNDPENPMYKTGRIKIMPRFIVGFSPLIAKMLAAGMPKESDRWNLNYDQMRANYEDAERCAKWCTVYECKKQANDIRYMLEHMDETDKKYKRPDELEEANKQIAVMCTYFDKALKLLNLKAQNDPYEAAAKEYAIKGDSVRRSITQYSNNIYVKNGWRSEKK